MRHLFFGLQLGCVVSVLGYIFLYREKDNEKIPLTIMKSPDFYYKKRYDFFEIWRNQL